MLWCVCVIDVEHSVEYFFTVQNIAGTGKLGRRNETDGHGHLLIVRLQLLEHFRREAGFDRFSL